MHLRHLHQGRELQVGQPILHKSANCFPISRSSIDLDWRTVIVVFGAAEGTVNLLIA